MKRKAKTGKLGMFFVKLPLELIVTSLSKKENGAMGLERACSAGHERQQGTV
jgi:hypothetical protein